MSDFRLTSRQAFLAIFLSLAVSLASPGVTRKTRSIGNGAWGGEHIRLEVTGHRATIEYDCARGTISGPLVVDSHGNFKLKGTHVREHGGPTRLGESDTHPAMYSGSTDRKQMTLTVVLSDTKEPVGTFRLIRGQQGHVWKCK